MRVLSLTFCNKMGHAGYGYNFPKVGEYVRDKESEDPEESIAIAIKVHEDTPASDYYIPSLQKTVAEVNPDYPEDAPVVTVAYVSDLDEINTLPGLEHISADKLAYVVKANGASTYDFPAPRLDLSASKPETMNKKNDNQMSNASEERPEDMSEDVSSISPHNDGMFDLSSMPDDLPLDGSGDERYIRRRSQYLKRVTDLREPLPKALAYREIGYSSSGIAKELDTRKETVEKWMDEIADQYGKEALETRPQSDPVPDLE